MGIFMLRSGRLFGCKRTVLTFLKKYVIIKKIPVDPTGTHSKNTLFSVFISLLETYERIYSVASYNLNYIPLLDNFPHDMKHMKKSWQIYKVAVSRLPDRPGKFRENMRPYKRSLEVAKNSHMRGPVGNTAFRGRPRAEPHLQAICEHMELLR